MGFNKVLLLLNDVQSEIDRDPAGWWERCKMAFTDLAYEKLHNGQFSGGQAIVEHHADDVSLIIAGGNYATVVETIRNGNQGHHKEEDQIRILKEILDRKGYRIVKKPARKRVGSS